MRDWKQVYGHHKKVPAAHAQDAYHNANWQVVEQTLAGDAAFAGGAARAGVCVVVNLPSVRAVRFLLAPHFGDGCGVYENRYRYAARVGAELPAGRARERIDKALAGVLPGTGLTESNGHYGAMELNGTGVRYYGDVCLVLNADKIGPDTLTLLRNSFEVRVPPAADAFAGMLENQAGWVASIQNVLRDWAGRWGADGVYIAACKIMENAPPSTRRMTTGTVSDGVLEDEDYIEVIMPDGFGPDDLDEIRLRAEDAAAEALIGDQTRVGAVPDAEQGLWRFRRRVAVMLAQGRSLPVRVVTTSGRSR